MHAIITLTTNTPAGAFSGTLAEYDWLTNIGSLSFSLITAMVTVVEPFCGELLTVSVAMTCERNSVEGLSFVDMDGNG